MQRLGLCVSWRKWEKERLDIVGAREREAEAEDREANRRGEESAREENMGRI